MYSVTSANIYLPNHRDNSAYGSKSHPSEGGSIKNAAIILFLEGYFGIRWILM